MEYSGIINTIRIPIQTVIVIAIITISREAINAIRVLIQVGSQ